jgi:hypothetical protein
VLNSGLRLRHAGILIISKEFLRKKWPMKELAALLARHKNNEVTLVVAMYQLTWDQVKDVRGMYDREPWCGDEARPECLNAWVALVEELMHSVTVIRVDQVRHHATPHFCLCSCLTDFAPAACTGVRQRRRAQRKDRGSLHRPAAQDGMHALCIALQQGARDRVRPSSR